MMLFVVVGGGGGFSSLRVDYVYDRTRVRGE